MMGIEEKWEGIRKRLREIFVEELGCSELEFCELDSCIELKKKEELYFEWKKKQRERCRDKLQKVFDELDFYNEVLWPRKLMSDEVGEFHDIWRRRKIDRAKKRGAGV